MELNFNGIITLPLGFRALFANPNGPGVGDDNTAIGYQRFTEVHKISANTAMWYQVRCTIATVTEYLPPVTRRFITAARRQYRYRNPGALQLAAAATIQPSATRHFTTMHLYRPAITRPPASRPCIVTIRGQTIR